MPQDEKHDMSIVLQRVLNNLEFLRKRVSHLSKEDFMREYNRLDQTYFMASRAVYEVAELFTDKMKKGPVYEAWITEREQDPIEVFSGLRNRLAHNFVASHHSESDRVPSPKELWAVMVSPHALRSWQQATMNVLARWTGGELQERQGIWEKEECLRYWVVMGDLEKVKSYLADDVFPNACDQEGNTPLHLAVGAQVSEDPGYWMRASDDDRVSIVQELLKMGAEVHARNSKGQTPLFAALATVREENRVVDALWGFPERIQRDVLERYIHRSANRYRQFLMLLLNAGAAPDARSEVGDTPLFYAVRQLDKNMVLLLLDHGADPNARTSVRDGAAAALEHIPVLARLLGSQQEAMAQEEDDSPLHLAVQLKSQDIVSLLLAHGADGNAPDMMLCTPLHWAVATSRLDIAQMLLDEVVDVNVQDREGDTPLHIASRRGYREIVEALLQAGSCPTLQNRKRLTPRDCLQHLRPRSRRLELARMLREAERSTQP